jgi:hypothetical protein
MATRKKTSKKSSKSKKTVARKSPAKPSAQKRSAPKKSNKRKGVPAKSASKKAATGKKAPAKKSAAKTITPKAAGGSSGKTRNQRQRSSPRLISRESSGLQSGDLQGLPKLETVDSESVDELLEEGNAFEAGIVAGVEDSGRREGKEVRTREVLEDDVPGEYLDED